MGSGKRYRQRQNIRLGGVQLFLALVAMACAPTGTPTVEQMGVPTDTPRREPTATEVPSPEPSDTPPVASLSGKVTYFGGMGFVPDEEATVYVVGREDLSSATDAEGGYELTRIPPGDQLIVAESPVGSAYQQITILEGEDHQIDLVTFAGYPFISAAPSGGIVRLDGQPVAGARVWTVARRDPILLETDAGGYFGFEFFWGPVIAVHGDRWNTAFLEAGEITPIELSRSGAVVDVPDVPVTASVPRSQVEGGPVVIRPTPILLVTLLPPVMRLQEDCLSYDPARLRIVAEGAQGWLLTDGTSRMLLLDSEADAEAALALARRHTAQCFIGRDNTRPNRRDYIVQYWRGNSGIATTIESEDCIAYNADSLRIVDEGAQGWLLTDGRSRMLILDDQTDTRRALSMAERYSQQCFIGRVNTRPNRMDYIVEYWK